jgi:hypothetical protein
VSAVQRRERAEDRHPIEQPGAGRVRHRKDPMA